MTVNEVLASVRAVPVVPGKLNLGTPVRADQDEIRELIRRTPPPPPPPLQPQPKSKPKRLPPSTTPLSSSTPSLGSYLSLKDFSPEEAQELRFKARALTMIEEDPGDEGPMKTWCYLCGRPGRSQPCTSCRMKTDAEWHLQEHGSYHPGDWLVGVSRIREWWPEEASRLTNREQSAESNHEYRHAWDDWYEEPW